MMDIKVCTTDILIKRCNALRYIKIDHTRYEKYEWLDKVYSQYSYQLEHENMFSDVIDNLVLFYNTDIRNINAWVVKNIVLKLYTDNYKTIGVKLRIFAAMLNKVDFDEEKKRRIHETFTNRVWEEYYAIVNETLPF